MFFIFGGRQTLIKDGAVMKYSCEHCKKSEYWELYTRRIWLTLFFVPLIPYSTEHLFMCPVCKHGYVIDNERYRELKAIADCNLELMNKRINEQEHANRIKQLLTNQNNNNDDDVIVYKKTQTQLNYLKQMQELERERENRLKQG